MMIVALSHATEKGCACGRSITKEGALFLCAIYIQRDDGSVLSYIIQIDDGSVLSYIIQIEGGSVLSYIIERDGGVERVCS